MGFTFTIEKNPVAGGGPVLIAHREEDPAYTTVLTYGHGDVVRGYDDQWRCDLSPWVLTQDGDRWFGRGSADNKGQHTINLASLRMCASVSGVSGVQYQSIDRNRRGSRVGRVARNLRGKQRSIVCRCLHCIRWTAHCASPTDCFYGVKRCI